MSKYGLLMDAEEITMEVSCALKGLRIIRDRLEDELFSIKKSGIFPGIGYMQELCDAMYSSAQMLELLNERLSASVEDEYKRAKQSIGGENSDKG